LESAGYVVDMAHNGVSADIKISKNTYDLVILDWNLQDAIGDQIAETIEKKHSETKIIFIPGNTYLINEFTRENEILLKPIEPEYLLETVAKIFPDEQIFECN
jgi:DNA-binding response OmpR family regulator